MTADFSLDTREARRKRHKYFTSTERKELSAQNPIFSENTI
jgi:hypothetical protein